MNAKGPVFKYGDNIDTDVIIPARYLNTQSPAELAAHCMEDIDKTFVTRVKAGDIMVGGENFGCGSSREHAPVAINFDTGVITDETTGQTFQAAPFPPFIQKIIKAGGLMKSIQEGK